MPKNYSDLQQAAKKLARRVKNEVESKIPPKKRVHQDYPAMAVACFDDISKCCVESDVSKSNFHGKLNARLHSELINKLGGDCGQTSTKTNSDNKIGTCAEVHAANKLLKKLKNHCSIKNIEFSKPIRPRTMQEETYCENCKKVFHKLKNK